MLPTILCLLLFQQRDGILPPWESKVVLEQIQQQTNALTAALGRLDTDHWAGDYSPLLVSTRRRVLAVTDALDRLIQKPESLSLAIEAFLSLQHIEVTVDSLSQGAERFQPSAVQGLEQASLNFQTARGQFQNYMIELAQYTEKNLGVDRKELESCRDQLWKRATAPPKPPAAPKTPAKRRGV